MSEKKYYNLAKLRGRMVEKFGSVTKACEIAGIRREMFSLAFNGKRELTPTEIDIYCNVLDIPDDEIRAYFFTEKVAKTPQMKGGGANEHRADPERSKRNAGG